MRMLSDELWDVDCLADLDKLFNSLILGRDDWEDISAIASAHGCVKQRTTIGAFFDWSHAVAGLLRIVEYVLPVARR